MLLYFTIIINKFECKSSDSKISMNSSNEKILILILWGAENYKTHDTN